MGSEHCQLVVHTLAYNVNSCLYAQRQDFAPFMSLYLKGRVYAKLAMKYLMTSFYATAIGVKCIINSPLSDIHKGNIIRQPIK